METEQPHDSTQLRRSKRLSTGHSTTNNDKNSHQHHTISIVNDENMNDSHHRRSGKELANHMDGQLQPHGRRKALVDISNRVQTRSLSTANKASSDTHVAIEMPQTQPPSYQPQQHNNLTLAHPSQPSQLPAHQLPQQSSQPSPQTSQASSPHHSLNPHVVVQLHQATTASNIQTRSQTKKVQDSLALMSLKQNEQANDLVQECDMGDNSSTATSSTSTSTATSTATSTSTSTSASASTSTSTPTDITNTTTTTPKTSDQLDMYPLFGLQPSDPCLVYDRDIYHSMRSSELKYVCNPEYMVLQRDLNMSMRCILVDWLVEVGEEYSLKPQTLYLTINYIDRFLSLRAVGRSKLQLLGVACMFLAAKYEEVYPPSVDDFVYISDNTYTQKEVLQMESEVLCVLKYSLTISTAFDFFRRFVEGAQMEKRVALYASYVLERFIQEPMFFKYRGSVLAASAVFLANHTAGKEAWPASMEKMSEYSPNELLPCVMELHQCQLHAYELAITGQHKLKAVFEKYADRKFGEVSKIPPPARLQ